MNKFHKKWLLTDLLKLTDGSAQRN